MGKTTSKSDAVGVDEGLAEAIGAARQALKPFAGISLKGDRRAVNVKEDGPGDTAGFTGTYVITRLRHSATITAADIQAAQDALERSDTDLAVLRKAIRPFAKIPKDERIEDPNQALYVLPGKEGDPIAITNAMIEAARNVLEAAL